MRKAAYAKNVRRLVALSVLTLLAAVLYLFVDVHFSNEKLFWYAMKIRTPKLVVMLDHCICDRRSVDRVPVDHQQYDRHSVSAWHEFALHADPHGGRVRCRFGKRSCGQCECGVCGRSGADGTRRDRDLQLSVSKDKPQCALCSFDRNGADLFFREYPDDAHKGDGPERIRQPAGDARGRV